MFMYMYVCMYVSKEPFSLQLCPWREYSVHVHDMYVCMYVCMYVYMCENSLSLSNYVRDVSIVYVYMCI